MTNSEQTGTSSARSPYGTGSIQDGHILGVLTGQVPITMNRPNECSCPGTGTMAHVRGCPLHPETDDTED